MKSKILEKPDKIVGYVLLIIGLIVVIIPTYFGISVIFTGGSAIPKILEIPVLSDDTTPTNNATVLLPISTADINEIIEKTFPAINLGLFLALSVILISAGSVIMGKGVSLIKEIKLRAVREAVKEIGEVEVEKKEKAK
jgi:ABC-type glycerol-3-phosphate transport system permease component